MPRVTDFSVSSSLNSWRLVHRKDSRKSILRESFRAFFRQYNFTEIVNDPWFSHRCIAIAHLLVGLVILHPDSLRRASATLCHYIPSIRRGGSISSHPSQITTCRVPETRRSSMWKPLDSRLSSRSTPLACQMTSPDCPQCGQANLMWMLAAILGSPRLSYYR